MGEVIGFSGRQPTRRTVLHVGIVKELLIALIRENGAGEVLKDWPGTDDEAIAAVEADPRSAFVLDPTCDKVGPDGACQGHWSDSREER